MQRESTSTHQLRTAIIVFTAALLVRALFCFVAIPQLDLPIGPGQKEFFTSTDGYIDLAVNLVDHGKYAFTPDAPPTTYRAPVFPAALALAYAFLGDAGRAVLWVNCLASALTCLVIYRLSLYLIGNRATLYLMLPVILFPLSIYYCTSSFSDTFVGLAVATFCWAVVRLFKQPNGWRIATCGAAIAFACLTKSVVLPIPILLVAYAIIRCREATPAILAATALGFGLTGIWTARNHAVSGEFVPVTGGLGFNLLIGNFMIDAGDNCDASLKHGRTRALQHVNAATGQKVSLEDLRPHGRLDVPKSIESVYRHASISMLVQHPTLLPRKLGINFFRFWYFSSSRTKSLANGLMNFAVLILATLSLPRLFQNCRRNAELLLLIVVSIVGLYSTIIVHSSRFCLPVVLLLLPPATCFALDAIRKVRTRNSTAFQSLVPE